MKALHTKEIQAQHYFYFLFLVDQYHISTQSFLFISIFN